MSNVEKDRTIVQDFHLPYDIDLCSFNCLGFAAGIYTWLPKGDLEEETDEKLIYKIIKEVNALSPQRVRLISGEEELRESEYLCVVFLESEKDFMHAVRKYKGRWVEKNGHQEISWLKEDINPLKDANCSWSKLSEVCSKPSKYLLAVNPMAPVLGYKYMSDSMTCCCLRVDARCEPYELYDLPYGVMFYDTYEEAETNAVGEGCCLWKINLQNIDKPIDSLAQKEKGILFNSGAYMMEILSVKREAEDTYAILAKPVLIETVHFEERVVISLASQLDPYLPADYSPISAFSMG